MAGNIEQNPEESIEDTREKFKPFSPQYSEEKTKESSGSKSKTEQGSEARINSKIKSFGAGPTMKTE